MDSKAVFLMQTSRKKEKFHLKDKITLISVKGKEVA